MNTNRDGLVPPYLSRVTLTPASTVPYMVMPDCRSPGAPVLLQPDTTPSSKTRLAALRKILCMTVLNSVGIRVGRYWPA